MMRRIVEKMDKKTVIKLLAGTITRGILWASAAISAKIGVEKLSESASEALGYFIASIVVVLISTWWSKRKDKKLLESEGSGR